jgi:hypothetical protein
MAITMQGSWTVRVRSKSAGFLQRFQIAGSDFADGTYAGEVATPAVFVTGSQWSINIQNQPDGGPWQDSGQRITFPSVSSGLVSFDIQSNDAGADQDYNDLVLTCSMPVSASEFVVYGNVQTYAGRCFFNPCYPWFWVIDSPLALERALGISELRPIIEKLYPERIPRPGPIPDPPPDFTPIVLPTGTQSVLGGIEFRSLALRADLPAPEELPAEKGRKKSKAMSADDRESAAVSQLKGTAHQIMFDAAPVSAGVQLLDRSDLLVIAGLADKFKIPFFCDVDDAPGLLLRFQEYDRTNSEKLGGPYTGTGAREDLGLAVTDEQGNYIFRFSRSPADFATEAADVASGESLSTQIFPDLIAQVLGTGFNVDQETAPYYNVPNLMRIDLCLPRDEVHPSTGCGGNPGFQRIGDILVMNAALGGNPNTLDADGRITCRNANAPAVDCAGWRGSLRFYICFGNSNVTSYSLRYKRVGIDTAYQFVGEGFALNHVPDFGPGYSGTPVGPTLRSVHVDGGAAITVETYDNHEGDSNWIENDLKLILNSFLYRPGDQPGSVDFKVEGYDAAGNRVAGTDDEIRLYIHNRTFILGRPNNSKGDIASITMGSVTLGDCALFELTDPKAPLTVTYRAVDPEGFLQSWGLTVTRGNNVSVPVNGVGGVPPSKAYTPPSSPSSCTSFTGTRDEPTATIADYVDTTLQPSSSADWLPTNINFCAFAFTLRVHDRVTDGRPGGTYPQVVFWQDLIGLSYTSPGP